MSEWRQAVSLVGEHTHDPGLGEVGCISRGNVRGHGIWGRGALLYTPVESEFPGNIQGKISEENGTSELEFMSE